MYYGDGNEPRQAVVRMPDQGQLGGKTPGFPALIQRPAFPTAPYFSTNPNVGRQVRYYSGGMIQGDTDYVVGTEAIRTIQFYLPCRVIAVNAVAADTTAANATAWEASSGLNTFLLRLEYTTGDRLQITQRIASTYAGSAERPGMIGDFGWNIDQGASVVLGITPLVPNLRIDVVLHCIEMRGNTNYSGPRYG